MWVLFFEWGVNPPIARHLSRDPCRTIFWAYRKLSLLCPHPSKKGLLHFQGLQGRGSASVREGSLECVVQEGVARTSLPPFIWGGTVASLCLEWQSAAVEDTFSRDSIVFDRWGVQRPGPSTQTKHIRIPHRESGLPEKNGKIHKA